MRKRIELDEPEVYTSHLAPTCDVFLDYYFQVDTWYPNLDT